jgi:hypothetical protein
VLSELPTVSWASWCTSVIPTLRSLRQEDHELEANLGYIAKLFKKKYSALQRFKEREKRII